MSGANLAAHTLKLRNKQYWYVYANIDDTSAFQKVRSVAASIKTSCLLRSARVGMFGKHPSGLETSQADGLELKEKFGVEIINIELDHLFERIHAVDGEKITYAYQHLEAKMENLEKLDQSAMECTLSAYVVLREIAREKRLDGIALRCGPEFFSDLGCSACGAISILIENGIPCSCEADVNGTITEIILRGFSGSPAVGTNIVSADFGKNQFIIRSCGLAPLSLADPTVRPMGGVHPNHDLPLLMEFPLMKGAVTIARLSRATGFYRLVISSGEMISAPNSFTGTTGVLRFESSSQEIMDSIFTEGLEHRISITYGKYQDSLVHLAKIIDLPVLVL